MCKNQFWKEVYALLLACRNDILTKYPSEFITIPINGEPFFTNNNKAIKQDWSRAEMINVILDTTGKIRGTDEFTGHKKPLEFEILELKRTLNDFVESLSGKGQGL